MRLFLLFQIFLIIISGCISSPQQINEVTIEVTRNITIEVTRITLITPIPTITPTATKSCYDDASTQYDLNQCAGFLAEKAKKEMDDLVERIASKYATKPEKANEFIQLQNEWETLSFEECRLWYGRLVTDPKTGDKYYENGSMAPMLMADCLKTKYENRIIELKWFLDF